MRSSELAGNKTAIELVRRQKNNHALNEAWRPIGHGNALPHPQRSVRSRHLVEAGDHIRPSRPVNEIFQVEPSQVTAEQLMQCRADESHTESRFIRAHLDFQDEKVRKELGADSARPHVSCVLEREKPIRDLAQAIIHVAYFDPLQ